MRVSRIALATLAVSLAAGVLGAARGAPGSTVAPEALEPEAPPGTSPALLDSLLDDDLDAGRAGGMPVALLEALVERDPERFGSTPDELYFRFGFLRAAGRERPVGVTERKVLGARLRNYNCLACHAGQDGQELVVGAPNRSLDFVAFFRTIIETTRAIVHESDCDAAGIAELIASARRYRHRHGKLLSPADAAALALSAEGFARIPDRDADPAYGPGRTVVAATYRALRFGMSPGPWAPVKTPDLFGVRARTNLLWTGNEHYDATTPPEERIARNGLLVPWVQPDPLTGRPAPDDEIVGRLDRHRRMASLLVRSTPPPAPAPADEAARALHARGRAVFEATCARCHGHYQQDEREGKLATRVLDYDEKLVPVERVATDDAYDRANDYEFAKRIGETAIGRLFKRIAPEHTYVARPLLGVRLRSPYLHNGSVPTLRALLTPPDARPRSFWVGADVPFDADACGYAAEPAGPLAQRRDTTLPGNRATGHPFGTSLSDDEKRALIAYLKTL